VEELQEQMPTMAKKIQKMRFVFEEDTQDDNDD